MPGNMKGVNEDVIRQAMDEVAKLIIKNIPEMKAFTKQMVEVVFLPKAMARQLALAITLETGMMTITQLFRILRHLLSNFSTHSRLIRQKLLEQSQAKTQDEWMSIAEQIDSIQGNDAWRSEPTCALYESDRIHARIDEFVHLMRRRDIFDLMFTLRGGIARNKFGLLHEGLFSKAVAGSKVLVETYHSVVCSALDFVCDAPVLPGDDPIPTEARLAFFNETRHSYGRTALLLSGGAALGFYHVGVVKALMENGLLPRVMGGSSAGSIVCSMIATRTDEECMRDLFNVEGTIAHGHSGVIDYDFFRPVGYAAASSACLEGHEHSKRENPLAEVMHNTAGAFHDAKKTFQLLNPIGIRWFTSFIFDVFTGHKRPKDLLKNDTEHLAKCIRNNIGNFTFQEAFDRTGRILNITVSPQNRSDPPRLLNYLTAPHVLVWSAALASSSLPGVFEANKLLVKDPDGAIRYESATGMAFQDGSMEADLPMQQLSEMFNINHFIISQANPHAVFFSSFNLNKSVWTNHFIGWTHGILLFLKNQLRAWFRNIIELVGGRRIAPLWDTRRGIMSQFFTQEYEGRDCDISLIPWQSHRSVFSALLHCIYNPSRDEFMEWAEAAERETWRYIPAIKSHCAEEMTLDRCVQRLRKRILQESWDAKRGMESTSEKMGQRVPSFFTSPSLVNLGGLGVGDRYNIHQQDMETDGVKGAPAASSQGDLHPNGTGGSNVPPIHSADERVHVDISLGWGGLGLRGNHSYGSLNRSHSSGLFYLDGDGDEERVKSATPIEVADGVDAHGNNDGQVQVAGEETATASRPSSPNRSSRLSFTDDNENLPTDSGYFKTTSMANFYYRKTKSHGNLHAADASSLTTGRDGVVGGRTVVERRKSRSIMDITQLNTSPRSP